MLRSICLVSGLFATSASAIPVGANWLNQEIMVSCQQSSFFKRGCSVNSGQILPTTCITAGKMTECAELTLSVKYDFPCNSGQLVFPSVQSSDGQFQTFAYQGKEFTVTGAGPFQIYDSNPDRTKDASLFKSCSLKITELTATLSEQGKNRLTDLRSDSTFYGDLETKLQSTSTFAKSMLDLIDRLDTQAIYGTLTAVKNKAQSVKDTNNQGVADREINESMDLIMDEVNLIQTTMPSKTIDELKASAKTVLTKLQGLVTEQETQISGIRANLDTIIAEYAKY